MGKNERNILQKILTLYRDKTLIKQGDCSSLQATDTNSRLFEIKVDRGGCSPTRDVRFFTLQATIKNQPGNKILIAVKNGYLDWIEYWWTDDKTPSNWPSMDEVVSVE